MLKNLGEYRVGEKTFYGKTEAIYHSYLTKEDISWNFYHSVWDNFSKNKINTLDNLDLQTIYKNRAIQLREKYDYLILNYSGGADSHNVLMTFLNNNNIKLDEIYVQRSSSVDEKLYKPNQENKNAENILSEWDYAIKPTLEYVAKYFPNIKINVEDIFTKNLDEIIHEDIFLQSNNFIGLFEMLRQSSYSSTINKNLDLNIKTCSIFGIDKPLIVIKNNEGFMLFSDQEISAASRCIRNDLKNFSLVELFYWTPEMPEVAFKQAKIVYEFFSKNKILNNMMNIANIDQKNLHLIYDAYREIVIPLIYQTWNKNTFQANKPKPYSQIGRSRDRFYIENSSFRNIIEKYNSNLIDWKSVLNEKYFFKDIYKFKNYYTPWYKLS
jgi:hypothetical protein